MNILKKMIKIADLKGNEKILDIGTGAGFLAIGFAKDLKDGKVTGLDKYSIKYDRFKIQLISYLKINFIGHTLKNAKRNVKIENVEDKCEFIQTDITKPLKFSDSYFDIIISSQFLYCLPPQKRLPVFQEINRILKKDGKIIFFESKDFLGWNINHAKVFFEKIGYQIKIIKTIEFQRTCILSGKKL
jgi:ubiquinone/menaquinone biosynthesis C-methylase UbiE